MKTLRNPRLAIRLALATVLAGQIASLTVACQPGALALGLLIAIETFTSLAAILLCWIGLRATHPDRARMISPLVTWLENIDVAGDSRPRPSVPLEGADSQLVATVDNLVHRVQQYRDKLLVRHQRVQRLLRNVTDVLYHTDSSGRISWITDTVNDMLGYRPAELEGRLLRDLLADPEKDEPALLERPQLRRHPTRVFRRDGSIAWLLISSRRIDDAHGQPIGSEGVCRDGTRLIETQHALDDEKERAQVTLASIGDAVITTNAHGEVDYLNPRAEQMLGVPTADAIGEHFDTLCNVVDNDRNITANGLVQACLNTGTIQERDEDLTLYDRAPQTTGHTVKVTISPIRDSHQHVVGTVIVLHDITRLQQISRELAHQANHDLLTGLPNRRAFEHLLGEFLAETGQGHHHALCYLDLDQFKLVNDTCGHDAGDEMLRQISNQISSQIRVGDTLARLGGDEFGLIMCHLSLTDAKIKAEALRTEIDRFRFRWNDKLFRLGASIGVAAIDREAVSTTELLRRADTACYLAKEKGRNQVYIYRGDSDETLTRHGDMQRMQQISEALDNDRFELFAQIIQPIDQRTHSRCGVELLLRMRDSDGAILSPQNFLLTAERYNVAARIDRWVLKRAVALIAAAGDDHAAIEHYSINISGQSITDEHFVDYARGLIEASSVDPRRLVFEITETTAVTNTRRAGELIRSLRALGCRFSLDDFGSGLSSFSYLKNLPSDFIKIDGKLVSNILQDPVERSIVEAINQVGQAMGLLTVAEHVESRALLDALRTIGIDYAQGYHVARPIPFEMLSSSIGARQRIVRAR
ncbi:EAL domain-containing protein [Endozoicomonas sp. G2_2]|uniref:EAL domain-containing protein n=1 Tax=Endozoicomonas sp. G2_2 TaxID=2821092 RepID=UPI001ADA6FCC|nr:EAL domain-containing protein [Endozoicomonas sp. G2_2]MBO9469528.1 EAL domain-containing protein [Endozoicomonas sp. G2_2]